MIRIVLTSVFVQDQERALDFYTRTLGFVLKHDLPLGEARWLTVVSSDGPDDVELLLEPNANPAARVYQNALYEQGIPAASFGVDSVSQEFQRLKALGVRFVADPVQVAPEIWAAVLDDTCGNLIQIAGPA